MRVLGIDEAGRGCVLGPLVVAGFLTTADDATLRAAGAGDSKAMSAKRRDAARARLAELGTADVRPISATAIDAGNLNTLEHDAILDLIRTWRPDRVIVDALGHPRTLPATVDAFRAHLARDGLAPEIVMVPKADATWPACGAASVFAKTTRDALLDDVRAAHEPFGSGYPSDPVTRAWLARHHASGAPWPPFVRTRWGTIRDLEAAD
ncbi:MAG: ribonuclease HII [Alphaproteobacteria bacterium]|nr:ribonuclease HII [Alphaproteobacteria bacterium]